jgi:hypothetical protein
MNDGIIWVGKKKKKSIKKELLRHRRIFKTSIGVCH